MVLMATDLPEPVVPATRRCGMRGEIGDDRLAANGLAEADIELALGLLEIGRREHFLEIDRLALLVRQFDANDVAAGHDGDAGGNGAHRAGNVVGQRNDAARFDAGGRFEFVKRDHRAGPDMDDVALDAEILEHAFELTRLRFELFGPVFVSEATMLRFGKKAEFRQFEPFGLEQRSLRLLGGATAGQADGQRQRYAAPGRSAPDRRPA